MVLPLLYDPACDLLLFTCNEKAVMVSIPKVFGVLSCGFLLCLGLSNAVQAEHAPSPSDVMKTDKTSDR